MKARRIKHKVRGYLLLEQLVSVACVMHERLIARSLAKPAFCFQTIRVEFRAND